MALPLSNVRILAIEQMQALPYATQLLSRFGADVVKVEPIGRGESGRQAMPAMVDPEGRNVGATFLRNNFNKRSICVDLKHPAGRELVLRLAPKFDVVAQNFAAGTIDRLGLGYEDVRKVHPNVVYLSVSGFGTLTPTTLRRLAGVRAGGRGDGRALHVPRRAGLPAAGVADGHARRHGLVAVRARRPAHRAVPPRAHRRGPARRHRHVRRHGRDGRRRRELLVARPEGRRLTRRSSTTPSGPRTAGSSSSAPASTSSTSSPRSSASPSGSTTRACPTRRRGSTTSTTSCAPRSRHGRRTRRSSRRRERSPRRASPPGR